MSNRIYVTPLGGETVELDPDEAIVFERDGVRVRIHFDTEGELKVNADERVTITPEASNVFVIRPCDTRIAAAARRVRKAMGDDALVGISADIADLVKAALR